MSKTIYDADTALGGTDNALIGLDLGFGKDTQVTFKVENPYYRQFGSLLPFTEADKKAFKCIEKRMQKCQKSADENRNGDTYNELLDAIANSIEWEVKDGTLVLKSNMRYVPQLEFSERRAKK